MSYDKYLKTGPYNFGWATTRPDWSSTSRTRTACSSRYWDTSQSDNDASEHPGEGVILPIDSHPEPIYRLDGAGRGAAGSRRTTRRSRSRRRTRSRCTCNGQASYIRGQAAQPLFDDTRSYWNAAAADVGRQGAQGRRDPAGAGAAGHLDEGRLGTSAGGVRGTVTTRDPLTSVSTDSTHRGRPSGPAPTCVSGQEA